MKRCVCIFLDLKKTDNEIRPLNYPRSLLTGTEPHQPHGGPQGHNGTQQQAAKDLTALSAPWLIVLRQLQNTGTGTVPPVWPPPVATGQEAPACFAVHKSCRVPAEKSKHGAARVSPCGPDAGLSRGAGQTVEHC